jgi:sulfate permease, SulP family
MESSVGDKSAPLLAGGEPSAAAYQQMEDGGSSRGGGSARRASRAAPATGCLETLRTLIPSLRWLPLYDPSTQLRDDLVCGLTLGVMLIPQGMAYATLAGLSEVSGLYASMMPMVVYGFMGTSKHMSFGPFALISILVSQGLSGAGFDDGACSTKPLTQTCLGVSCAVACYEYEQAASLMSIMAGVVHVLLCALRLDVLATVLADPVMTGFTTAAAFIIGTSQVSKFVGFKIERSLSFMEHWFSKEGLLPRLGETHWLTLVVAVTGLVLLIVLQNLNRKYCKPPRVPIPTQLVAVVLGIVAVLVFKLDEHGVAVVGHIDGGLPRPTLPPLGNFSVLLGPSIVVAFISFIINTSIAKLFSQKFEYPVSLKSELLATGVANVVGGFFHCYPSSGSLSRGAVIASVGAARVSLLHNVISASVIALTLVALTSLFTKLPTAILAGIIIMAIIKLVNFGEARRLYRTGHYSDCAMYWVAFWFTLLLGVQNGILLAIGCSLLGLLYFTSRPHCYTLGVLPGTNLWVDVARYPDAAPLAGVLAFRFGASLHFANKDFFAEKLLRAEADANDALALDRFGRSDSDAATRAVSAAEFAAAADAAEKAGEAAAPPPAPAAEVPTRVSCIVVDCSSMHDVDSSAMKMLTQASKAFALSGGVALYLASLTDAVKAQMLRDDDLMKQLRAMHDGSSAAPTSAISDAYGDGGGSGGGGADGASSGYSAGLFASLNEAIAWHSRGKSAGSAANPASAALVAPGALQFAEVANHDAEEEVNHDAFSIGIRRRKIEGGAEDEEGGVVAHAFEGEGDHWDNV